MLSQILTILTDNQIGIFVILTFNLDYILAKAHKFDRAMEVLAKAGYEVVE
jgi:hypothetical protein